MEALEPAPRIEKIRTTPRRRNTWSGGDFERHPYGGARFATSTQGGLRPGAARVERPAKFGIDDIPLPSVHQHELLPMERFLHENQIMRRPATPSRAQLISNLTGGFKALCDHKDIVSRSDFARFPSMILQRGKLVLWSDSVASIPLGDDEDELELQVLDQKMFRKFLGKTVLKLTTEILTCSGALSFLEKYQLHWQQTHHVMIQFDYYPERSKSQTALHRDSRGSTLFAFLIFCGSKSTGTEIVRHARKGQEFDRLGVGGSAGLPPHFREAVNRCIPTQKLPLQRLVVQETAVKAGDILGFVDPLVFHRTPTGKSVARTDLERETPTLTTEPTQPLILGTGPVADDFGLVKRPKHLKRTGDKADVPRSFFRIWVTFEPKDVLLKPSGTWAKNSAAAATKRKWRRSV